MGRPRASIPANAGVLTALTKTITALGGETKDVAAVQLARKYAAAIDAAPGDVLVLEKLGPKLLAALVELGATPAARGKTSPAGGEDADRDPVRVKLDELRARRASRGN